MFRIKDDTYTRRTLGRADKEYRNLFLLRFFAAIGIYLALILLAMAELVRASMQD